MFLISSCIFMILAASQVQALTPLLPNFYDPTSSTPPEETLQILIPITPCPAGVVVTVTVEGDGTSLSGFPQFVQPAGSTPLNGVYFSGQTVATGSNTGLNGAANGAYVTFIPSTDSPLKSTSISQWQFTGFDSWSNNPLNIPSGYYGYSVGIIVYSNNALAGPDAPPYAISATPVGAIVDSTTDKQVTFSVSAGTSACSSVNQDPIFVGFQGQEFQFHGLPDEHFNLISTPNMQVNSHFVYLASGKCDYNDSFCWTHPGTYIDVLGFTIGETRVKVQAGPHDLGLRVWLMDNEITPAHRSTIVAINNSTDDTATIRFTHRGSMKIKTPLLDFDISNSDFFMNLAASLNDRSLLKAGRRQHAITQHEVCNSRETSNHQLVETTVAKLYSVHTHLHGLVGQTWRNVKVCGRDWMGVVEDYLVSDLFGTEYHYNYFTRRT